MQYNYIIKFQPIFSLHIFGVQILVSQTSKKALANGKVEIQWRKFYVLNLEQFDFCKIVCIVSFWGILIVSDSWCLLIFLSTPKTNPQ
jgi:hypothetical protein